MRALDTTTAHPVPPAPPRASSPVEDPALATTLQHVAGSLGVVGATIAIVRPGRPTVTTAFGHADLASGRPVGPDTAFPWFSMTKIVTATAVMQLVEHGELDLDAPAADLVPALGRMKPRRARPITVRHLLSHSSGLANPIPVRWVHPASEPTRIPATSSTASSRRHRRLRAEPGAEGRYTNLGYLALGQIVAAATGVPFVDHVRRHILEPLGMSATHFDAPRVDETTVYQTVRRGMTPALRLVLPRGTVGVRTGRRLAYRPFRVDGAAYGGLVGTVTDAATFVRAHLDPTAPSRLLDPATVARMQAITISGTRYDHGLGWYRPRETRPTSPRYVEHLGGGLGVYDTMSVYPDLDLAVVIMSNTPGYDLDALLDPIVRVAEPGPDRVAGAA